VPGSKSGFATCACEYSICSVEWINGDNTVSLSLILILIQQVDLAGSERFQNQSAARQKESASINLSLNTLGNVISALTSIRKGSKIVVVVAHVLKLRT